MKQQQLFTEPQWKPERPSWNAEAVYDATAKALACRVGEADADDIKSALKACGLRAGGYDLAKRLEDDHGYIPDAEMVEDLDYAWTAALDAHTAIVEKWVEENTIEPPLSIGDHVRFNRACGKKEETGEIVKVYRKKAKYLVYCEHLGHVREGIGTQGFNLDYEDCEAA